MNDQAGHKVMAADKAKPHATDMCALGELICRLNPYTRLRKDPVTGQSTSGMAIEPAANAQPRGRRPRP